MGYVYVVILVDSLRRTLYLQKLKVADSLTVARMRHRKGVDVIIVYMLMRWAVAVRRSSLVSGGILMQNRKQKTMKSRRRPPGLRSKPDAPDVPNDPNTETYLISTPCACLSLAWLSWHCRSGRLTISFLRVKTYTGLSNRIVQSLGPGVT